VKKKFEQEADMDEGILLVADDMEAMAMVVEEAVIFSCFTFIVQFWIMPRRSIYIMCNWFK